MFRPWIVLLLLLIPVCIILVRHTRMSIIRHTSTIRIYNMNTLYTRIFIQSNTFFCIATALYVGHLCLHFCTYGYEADVILGTACIEKCPPIRTVNKSATLIPSNVSQLLVTKNEKMDCSGAA